MNANFSAVATEYNAHAVQTDVAKTITVTHTFSATQTFSAGITVSSGGVTATGNSSITGALSGVTTLTTSGAINGQTISSSASFTGTLNTVGFISAGDVIQSSASFPAFILNENTQPADNRRWDFAVNSKTLWGRVTNDANSTATNWLTVSRGTGNVVNSVTLGAPTVVSTGGIAVTGNSNITGNLSVTGTITAVQGSSAYVRATTTVNFTSATDLGFAFAVGASQEWEFEYVLTHTNASAATASFTVTGPASSTGYFGAIATVFGAGSATQGAVQLAIGNSLTGLTMNATAGYTVIRGYIKTAGTSGNVAISGTVSAGTGVLQAGSFVKYARIA